MQCLSNSAKGIIFQMLKKRKISSGRDFRVAEDVIILILRAIVQFSEAAKYATSFLVCG